MSEHVVLLHGIWMRGFSLAALRQRLEQAGFVPHVFEYASVVCGPGPSVTRLIELAGALGASRLHFVGHSLGGLVALQALRHAEGLPDGRVVCLGSPLTGSAAARGLARFPGGGWLMGRSFDILRDGLERWDGHRPVGSIAGRLPIGLGFVVGPLASPNDGTVSVEETRLPGIADHCVVAATHTGLLFSEDAARQTILFLRDARFEAA